MNWRCWLQHNWFETSDDVPRIYRRICLRCSKQQVLWISGNGNYTEWIYDTEWIDAR